MADFQVNRQPCAKTKIIRKSSHVSKSSNKNFWGAFLTRSTHCCQVLYLRIQCRLIVRITWFEIYLLPLLHCYPSPIQALHSHSVQSCSQRISQLSRVELNFQPHLSFSILQIWDSSWKAWPCERLRCMAWVRTNSHHSVHPLVSPRLSQSKKMALQTIVPKVLNTIVGNPKLIAEVALKPNVAVVCPLRSF